VFVHCTQADTLERLERAKESLNGEIAVLDGRCVEYKDTLSGLKAQLYAKFGNNINLEADDD